MSKELEALERLWKEAKGNPNTSPFSNRSDYDKIRETLFPPTEQELCEEMIKHFVDCDLWDDIRVWRDNKEFILYHDGDEERIVFLAVNGIVFFDIELPAYLVTMVGRFYESLGEANGLVKEE